MASKAVQLAPGVYSLPAVPNFAKNGAVALILKARDAPFVVAPAERFINTLNAVGQRQYHRDFSNMQRRQIVQWAAATSLGCVNALQAQPLVGLHAAAQRSGRSSGFAVAPSYASQGPVAALLARHAGVITAENAMKWGGIENLLGRRRPPICVRWPRAMPVVSTPGMCSTKW